MDENDLGQLVNQELGSLLISEQFFQRIGSREFVNWPRLWI
jgi:hypothetical protein